MRRRFLSRALLTLTLVLGSLTLTPSTASAGHGDWHRSTCRSNVWYLDVDVTDQSSGIHWLDAWLWWIDYGYYGHNEYTTYGPIQSTWASYSAWECGRLGVPWSNVRYAYSDWDGYPVYRQGFSGGYIDWHSQNSCWCYNWGGWAEVIYY